VDSSGADYVVPPLIDAWPDEADRDEMMAILQESWDHARGSYERLLRVMNRGIDEHFPQYTGTMRRKRMREAARAPMPNMTETLLDITGNHRAFREFCQKRCADAADLEIQALAKEMLRQLTQIAPNTYQDMEGLLSNR